MDTIDMNQYELYWELKDYHFFWHDLFVYNVYANRMVEAILGFQEENMLCTCNNGNYKFYLKKDEIAGYQQKTLSFFNSESFDTLISNIKKIIAESKRIKWDYYDCNDFLKAFSFLKKKHMEVSPYYFCTEANYVDHLYDFLRSCGYSKDDIMQFTRPEKMPTVIREQLEFYKICINTSKNNRNLEELLSKHLEKWRYIIAKSRTEPYSKEKLQARYDNDIKNIDAINDAYKNLKEGFLENSTDNENCHAKMLFGSEYSLIKKLRELSFLRWELRSVWMKSGYLIASLLKRQFPEKADIFFYSADEITAGKFESDNDRRNFVYLLESGRHRLFYNDTQKSLYFLMNKTDQRKGDSIFGKISYGVRTKGWAYVLENNEDILPAFEVVNTNTILVLFQLCPEHIPLVAICRGLVVDEGGIAGHACIIAREMKKSAVVGTVYGTKTIYDNDYIELDTESNCVRRIKENV